MGEDWLREPYDVLTETAYLHLVAQALRRLPAQLPVFRVVTDSPPAERLAPPNVYPKGRFLHHLAQYMRENGWKQGDSVSGPPATPPPRGFPLNSDPDLREEG